MKKTCSRCNETKPEAEFYWRSDRRDDRYPWCKACRSKWMHEWYVRNREKVLLASKVYYRQNRPTRLAWMRKNYRRLTLRKYGLTIDGFSALLAAQGDGCAICGGTRRLVVDHDHATGAVRGILCERCNYGLGAFKDDKALLLKAIGYLAGSRKKMKSPSA